MGVVQRFGCRGLQPRFEEGDGRCIVDLHRGCNVKKHTK